MASTDDSPRPASRTHYSRAAHRARSHDSAHAESSPPQAHIPTHPLVPQGPARLVTTNAQLADLIVHLRASGRFAYDSEFIGELTYFPKLCLIQVASSEQVALIDPLAEIDLIPFWELLCDPSVEKILHACQQDVEPVVRHLGREPANLFDTQVAAGFVGLPYPVSLSKLVNEMTGVRLGKGLTFSHWDQRPLSAMQLRYAADDVRYLPLVRDQIGNKLDALGHARWAAEECASFCSAGLYRFDAETQYLRVRGANSLQPRNLAVLREMTIWRDAAARQQDVPPRAFLKDEILIDLSRNPVKSVDKLDRVRGLPRPVESEYGAQIVEATHRALTLAAPDLPTQRDAEQTPTEKFRSDALWALAQCVCAGQSVDAAVVTNRQEISDFYTHITTGPADPPHHLLTGWRRDALGDALANLIRGKAQVNFRWVDDGLRATLD